MSNRFEYVTGLDKAVTEKGKQNEAMGELLEGTKVSFTLWYLPFWFEVFPLAKIFSSGVLDVVETLL